MKDYRNCTPQINSSFSGGGGNNGFNPFVINSKIKDLESKIITLEETNKILVDRINIAEKLFSVQLNQLELNNQQEKENNYKTKKIMNIISEQSNSNSNALNMKINTLKEKIILADEDKSQQRQFDLESQKYLIGKLTEKVTKIIKSEVEARYKADMNGKIFSHKMNDKFESSLDIIKKEMKEIVNQTKIEIEKTAREFSEKTHNLSKYIDQRIQEIAFGKGSMMEELKHFVRKLTEQVKTGLLSISDKHIMIENRLKKIEEKYEGNKNEFHKYMYEVDKRLMRKIKDIKIFTELNMTRHDQYLEKNMTDVTNNIEKNIQFIAGQIIDTRIKVNERFTKIFQEHHELCEKMVEDMEEICGRLYKYENLLKEYENNFKNTENRIQTSLANIYSREDVNIVLERMIKTIEYNFLQEQINTIQDALQTCNKQFAENMNELNKGSNNNMEFINNQLKEQTKKINEIAEKQKKSEASEVKQNIS